MGQPDMRRQLGAWYTPPALVDAIVDAVLTEEFVARRGGSRRPIRVLDPACGDGRFLVAAQRRVESFGSRCELIGVDIDAEACDAASASGAVVICADALSPDWESRTGPGTFDVVLGNPPFLSQLASSTTRGGASRHGGGPYADAAVEFLALSAAMVDSAGGRVGFVLPQSILAARDAAPVRRAIDRRAEMFWSSWTGERVFDAQVYTCAVAFEFSPRPAEPDDVASRDEWSHVVTEQLGVPPAPVLADVAGTLGDRARLNANFRDEYYGMQPAVGDHETGPKLVTSGLIDPGTNLWARRAITFARRRYARPRLDLAVLDPKMSRWAAQRLVPKVLVANQTRIIEAVCDPDGSCLPGVPVIGIYPAGLGTTSSGGASRDAVRAAWEITAVLTSPVASVRVWHRGAGTGLSADTIRLGPVGLGELPWPTGSLDEAVAALRRGDIRACGRCVTSAYGVENNVAGELFDWWERALWRIEARQPAPAS